MCQLVHWYSHVDHCVSFHTLPIAFWLFIFPALDKPKNKLSKFCWLTSHYIMPCSIPVDPKISLLKSSNCCWVNAQVRTPDIFCLPEIGVPPNHHPWKSTSPTFSWIIHFYRTFPELIGNPHLRCFTAVVCPAPSSSLESAMVMSLPSFWKAAPEQAPVVGPCICMSTWRWDGGALTQGARDIPHEHAYLSHVYIYIYIYMHICTISGKLIDVDWLL